MGLARDRPRPRRGLTLLRRLAFRHIAGGLLAGAVCLGIGGRLAMRAVAHAAGLPPAFSAGGSAEVLLYGALVGAVAGAAGSVLRDLVPRAPWIGAPLLGAATCAGTIATLPAHVWETLAAFAEHRTLIALLFGPCFLAFGTALAWIVRR